MRKLFTIVLALSLLSFFLVLIACKKEKELNVDFRISVDGVSPFAKVKLTNLSSNFTSCYWLFSAGCADSISYQTQPSEFVVDKKGVFRVVLIVKNGTEQKSLSKEVYIEGENGILSFVDVKFSHEIHANTIGRCFSTKHNKMYKDKELSILAGQDIDIVFQGLVGDCNVFVSPTDYDFLHIDIPGAQKTLFRSKPIFDDVLYDFDEINDAGLLDITDNFFDEEIVPADLEQPAIFLFQNAQKKKGIVRLKRTNGNVCIADIKVQKY